MDHAYGLKILITAVLIQTNEYYICKCEQLHDIFDERDLL